MFSIVECFSSICIHPIKPFISLPALLFTLYSIRKRKLYDYLLIDFPIIRYCRLNQAPPILGKANHFSSRSYTYKSYLIFTDTLEGINYVLVYVFLLYTNPLLLQNTICSKAYKFKKRFCTIYTLSACCLLTCYLKHSSGSMSRFSKEKLLFYLPTLRLRVRVLFRFRYVFENVWSPAKVTKIVRKSLLLGTILGSNWCRHSSKDLKLNLQKSVNPIYAHFYDLLLRMYMNDCAAGCAKSGSTCYRKRDVLFDMTLL